MKIVISDQHEDGFIRNIISVIAEDGGISRHWRIPSRLMRRPEVAGAVVEEIAAEISETRKRIAEHRMIKLIEEKRRG